MVKLLRYALKSHVGRWKIVWHSFPCTRRMVLIISEGFTSTTYVRSTR